MTQNVPVRDELNLARLHCRGMRELIESNPAHWKDEHALELLRALCRKAFTVMRDPVCRSYLAAVDDYAAALPWQHDLAGWSPGRMLGPWLVRREVLRKLRLLSERLAALEKAPAPPPAAPSTTPSLIATSPMVRQLAGRRRERYANALRLAAEGLGGTARLAFVLRVPRQDLERWIGGEDEAPLETFLSALDLVAAGPLARENPVAAPSPVPAIRGAASAPVRAAPAFEAALFAVLAGAALVGIGGWVAYFRGTPGLAAGAALAGWLCVAAVVLVRCMREPSQRTSVRIALLGSAVLFSAAMLLVPRAEKPAPAPRMHATPNASPVLRAKLTPAPADAPAPRAAPRVHKAAAGATAKPAVARVAALNTAEDRCSSLTGLASLQCQRCEQETGVRSWFCQERVRLQYCDGRDGTDPHCPSVIPTSLAQ